ncbi:cyclase family protein [Saccharopolyspora spinosa]|uniref:cyclase family protein n=1 Tax=Saccharopolyspora spinosa TaxID=60894 RepID=UPI00192A8624|nr:cyclase family protein [Saccharopolyspora spinosa]
MATVRDGNALTLAIPISEKSVPFAGMRTPPLHMMVRDGGDYAAGKAETGGFGFSDDYLFVACHGTTHLDALSHVWQDGLMWNGFSANEVTSRGARRCGIEKTGPIVTRGVFLDFANSGSDVFGIDELTVALNSVGITLRSGDALLIRSGWLRRWREGHASTDTWPGLGAECAEWLDEQGVSLVGADNIAVEPFPSGVDEVQVPLHIALMRDRGVHFMELLDLEKLAESGRHEFLLVVSPLPIVGGVGSPVAPVAVL